MSGNTRIQLAEEFAIKAHGTQVRKYTGEPYWFHCREVAQILTLAGCTENQIIAGWLHDVVEDTNYTTNDIVNQFGPEVALLVWWKTDPSIYIKENRAVRKAIDREHIAKAPIEAQDIACADLISNTLSISIFDPAFAKVYLEEKRLTLAVLTRADALLWLAAQDALHFAMKMQKLHTRTKDDRSRRNQE